jgi:hypothetical protein
MLLCVPFVAVSARLGSCLAVACLSVACLAACTASPATAPVADSTPGTLPASAAASHAPRPKPKPKPKPPRVSVYRVRAADGAVVTVAVFRGAVKYVLHNGGLDPGYAAVVKGVKAGNQIGAAERRRLLASFNGGFKLSTDVGGYEQEGHVISPLLKGYASLIIDRSGRARIAVWGHGAPMPGEPVYSVRQNLQPLVEHGRPTAAATDWHMWGATLGGGENVARSAIGEDAAGDLLYAGSMAATPLDIARALTDKGARIAMELDINPEWVQLDVAHHPGGPLRAAVTGQVRPADQFIQGWSRDFFTVLAR